MRKASGKLLIRYTGVAIEKGGMGAFGACDTVVLYQARGSLMSMWRYSLPCTASPSRISHSSQPITHYPTPHLNASRDDDPHAHISPMCIRTAVPLRMATRTKNPSREPYQPNVPCNFRNVVILAAPYPCDCTPVPMMVVSMVYVCSSLMTACS